MARHRNLTGADLHEPKGIETASVDTIYVANGANSGTWKKVSINQIDTSSVIGLKEVIVPLVFTSVSQAQSILLPINRTLSISSASVILNGTFTGSNVTLTVYKNSATSLGTLAITAASSVEGFKDSISLSANSFLVSDYIKITNSGTGTGTVPFTVSLTLIYN